MISIIYLMTSITIADIERLVINRKGNYKLRVCVCENRLILLKTPKIFYNHKKTCKSCEGVHVTISRDSVKNDIQTLRMYTQTITDNFALRKLRSDRETKHKYPKTNKDLTKRIKIAKNDIEMMMKEEINEPPIESMNAVKMLADYSADELIL